MDSSIYQLTVTTSKRDGLFNKACTALAIAATTKSLIKYNPYKQL